MNRTLKAMAAIMLMMVFAVGCNKPDEPNNGGNSGGGNNGNNDSDVRVTTYTPQDITANTAVCGGDVIAVQGLSLSGIGVCWSTENNPTIDDSHVFSEQWNEPFVRVIVYLEPETQYYVRAYALRGLMCYYGEVKSFTTLENNNNNNGNDTILEGKPFIRVLQGEGYVYNGQTIDVNTEYNFGIRVASNSQTMKELATFTLSRKIFDLDDIEVYTADTTFAISGIEYVYHEVLSYTLGSKDLVGKVSYTTTVADVDGKTNSVTINLSVNQPAQLLEVKQFTWIRRGMNFIGNTEEKMAEYGLQWSGNYKDVFATIKPLDGSVLYVCNGNDYWDITTDVEKAAYFSFLMETTSPIESYRNITISNSANYNDLLAVREDDGDIHLILISRAEIENGNFGTQISIIGEVK